MCGAGQAEDGTTTGWEEYVDYLFPDELKPQASTGAAPAPSI